jgi:hypothetical protein
LIGSTPVAEATVTIGFPDVTPDEGNLLAESLEKDVRQALQEDKVKVTRKDPTAQDFGATLVLVLGAPSVIILANAIRDWARRRGRGEIEIDGVKITGINSEDTEGIVKALKTSITK